MMLCCPRLEALPDYIMSHILSQLSHADLAAISSSCTALRAQAMQTVPGLRLNLYPHQVSCKSVLDQLQYTLLDRTDDCVS